MLWVLKRTVSQMFKLVDKKVHNFMLIFLIYLDVCRFWTLAIIVDPDEMPNNAAFHQGRQSLLSQNLSSEKEIQYFY